MKNFSLFLSVLLFPNLHADVVKDLTQRYNKYWDEIKPGHNAYPRPIVGSEKAPEIWLTPDGMVHDHARAQSAMHDFVLNGDK